MNLRNVLRAYGLLRNLSDDESALLNILRALNDNDREQLVASMSDKPVKKPTKKPAGKGGGGKSKHASSLAEKVGGTLASIAKTVGGDDEGAEKVLNAIEDSVSDRCQFTRQDGRVCMLLPDHNIHHLATAMDYHQFQSTDKAVASSGD